MKAPETIKATMTTDFNALVYEKIKKAGQESLLQASCCELEADNLYMGEVYNAASLIIPKDYCIVDLGCYMAAQSFLFDEHKVYIGVDDYDVDERNDDIEYIPPKRFQTPNGVHLKMNIEDFLRVYDNNAYPTDINHTYVIMSAVPWFDHQKVLKRFPNVAITYPGEKPVFQGAFADEMAKFTHLLEQARCPYVPSYVSKHPEVKARYDEAKEELNKEWKRFTGKTITISKELEEKILAFCDDELNYHINESGCAKEYETEITAQIELLTLLGHEDMAEKYQKEYLEACEYEKE